MLFAVIVVIPIPALVTPVLLDAGAVVELNTKPTVEDVLAFVATDDKLVALAPIDVFDKLFGIVQFMSGENVDVTLLCGNVAGVLEFANDTVIELFMDIVELLSTFC